MWVGRKELAKKRKYARSIYMKSFAPIKEDRGFTLIELLIVVSIIAILAAIAIPQFNQYRDRAKKAEAYALVGEAREGIVEFYAHTGRFPADNAEAGLSAAESIKGKFVKSVTVTDGTIVVLFDEEHYREHSLVPFKLVPVLLEGEPGGPVKWEEKQLKEERAEAG